MRLIKPLILTQPAFLRTLIQDKMIHNGDFYSAYPYASPLRGGIQHPSRRFHQHNMAIISKKRLRTLPFGFIYPAKPYYLQDQVMFFAQLLFFEDRV